MPTQVVLPHGLPAHEGAGGAEGHKDAWHQFEGLVFVLIGIHVAALAFWGYLLYASRERKRAKLAAAAKSGAKAGGGGGASGSAVAGGADWRTPKEIMRAYQKQHLGKH